MTLDTTVPNTDFQERIAFRSTRGMGAFKKKRWTELAVYYLHRPTIGGQRWVAEICGKSEHEGEIDKRTSIATATLTQALRYFDDSAPARNVAEQAHVWCELHTELLAPPPAANPPANDEAALAWLYGEDATKERGFVTRVAADFGMNESTVRMALGNGTGLRVPLVSTVAFMDHAAFRAASDARAARVAAEKANG